MLTDPASVTYNGSAKSLVRISQDIDSTIYATSDGEFWMQIRNSLTRDGLTRREVLLERRAPDPTPDPFSGGPASVSNRFGLIFETNLNRFESSTDIPLLRTALLAYVDSTLQGRILAGEK
jgi:hypothetical protein